VTTTEIVVRDLKRAKPGVWCYVQVREEWSTEEEAHRRPGHFWICKIGTFPGTMSCVERKFELQGRKCKWDQYKVTRYSDGDSVLVVELWLHRGSPGKSAGKSAVRNSLPPHGSEASVHLDTVAHGDRRTCDATVRKIQGVGNSTFVLSVENDNDFRSRCE
jgi:hypothetical protein